MAERSTSSTADADAALLRLLADRSAGVLATMKRDGRPQLSNILYAYFPAERLVRVSITADRAKYHNLRRDSRASLHVSSEDFWSYAVVEGHAVLSEVAGAAKDPTVGELVLLHRAIRGEHPDWAEFRAAMVSDRRVVLRLPVTRLYGQPPR